MVMYYVSQGVILMALGLDPNLTILMSSAKDNRVLFYIKKKILRSIFTAGSRMS